MAGGQTLRQFNLNALPVLREVLKHRNLTRAAEELNLTQSAVSNCLKQLRAHFGDDLLVRDGRRMQLTEKGQRLAVQLDDALAAVQRTLAPADFAPQASRQRFRIATADYVMAIFAPPLAALLQAAAPAMSVQFLTARRQSSDDLRVGRVDMTIVPRRMLVSAAADNPAIQQEFASASLLIEPFVCLGRIDDPDLVAGLTPERYLARAHASFFLDHDLHASLEQFHLSETATPQFDRILTSSFCTLPLIAATSDCLVLLPESLARQAIVSLPLRMVPAPIPVPPIELMVVWHRRRSADVAMQWMRDQLAHCARDIMV